MVRLGYAQFERHRPLRERIARALTTPPAPRPTRSSSPPAAPKRTSHLQAPDRARRQSRRDDAELHADRGLTQNFGARSARFSCTRRKAGTLRRRDSLRHRAGDQAGRRHHPHNPHRPRAERCIAQDDPGPRRGSRRPGSWRMRSIEARSLMARRPVVLEQRLQNLIIVNRAVESLRAPGTRDRLDRSHSPGSAWKHGRRHDYTPSGARRRVRSSRLGRARSPVRDKLIERTRRILQRELSRDGSVAQTFVTRSGWHAAARRRHLLGALPRARSGARRRRKAARAAQRAALPRRSLRHARIPAVWLRRRAAAFQGGAGETEVDCVDLFSD